MRAFSQTVLLRPDQKWVRNSFVLLVVVSPRECRKFEDEDEDEDEAESLTRF